MSKEITLQLVVSASLATAVQADTVIDYARDAGTGLITAFEVDTDCDGTIDKTWAFAVPTTGTTGDVEYAKRNGTPLTICEVTKPIGDCVLTKGDSIKVGL